MVKFNDDFNYDDGAATAEKSFAPAYGVFKATISEILPSGGEKFERRLSKGNQVFYKARYVFKYKDADGKDKTKSLFLNPGIWFPEEMKQLLKATKHDNPEGRQAIMNNTDALLGATVKIAIGARKKEWGDAKTFEGYEVGEYEGKEFLRNEIIGIGDDAKIDENFEKELRERFKNNTPHEGLAEMPGFENEAKATSEDLDF